ncbi:MAG: thiamine diphosphokinase [Sphaerochaetaceae bacterium]|nr:thiamine diphosphokinase [Sphaerochaetaceae bacterium]
MNTAIVVTGGNAPLFIPETLPLDGYYIIAADSGLEIAVILGLKCNLAIGDFDSIQNLTLLNEIAIEKFPKDKDYSDTELAIRYVKNLGFEDYILIGGGEGRMDHLMNIWSLFNKYGCPKCWITRKEAMYLVDGKRSFETAKGETVSIMPATLNEKCTVTAKNLKWPLDNMNISSNLFSLSNEANKGNLLVETNNGAVYTVFSVPREEHW